MQYTPHLFWPVDADAGRRLRLNVYVELYCAGYQPFRRKTVHPVMDILFGRGRFSPEQVKVPILQVSDKQGITFPVQGFDGNTRGFFHIVFASCHQPMSQTQSTVPLKAHRTPQTYPNPNPNHTPVMPCLPVDGASVPRTAPATPSSSRLEQG